MHYPKKSLKISLPNFQHPLRPASALNAVREFLMANRTLTDNSKAGSPVAEIVAQGVLDDGNLDNNNSCSSS